MSLLNLNTEPPNNVSRRNMNLSDMYAKRSSRTYAIPYFNRDTGKMEINELDPVVYINSILSDRGRDNISFSPIDNIGARDYNIYSREKLNNLPAHRRQEFVAKAAEKYIEALGGRMTYGDYMNLSEKEKQDNEKIIPTVLTTSQKLSTGVDARNVRNIVLFRPVNSMIEFKQIIGRGTRLFEEKYYFTIFDYEDAYLKFFDEEWDGEEGDEGDES